MILFALGGGIIGSGGLSVLVAASDRLQLQKEAVLLDCGKRSFANQSNQTIASFPSALQIIESSQAIKAIIISHAHVDHFGALPDASTFAPHAPIYVPEGSKQLISLQLRKKVFCSSWYEDDDSIDEAMDKAIEQIISKIQEIPFYQRTSIPNSSFSFQLFPAGHIMGSAMIYLKKMKNNFFFPEIFLINPYFQ